MKKIILNTLAECSRLVDGARDETEHLLEAADMIAQAFSEGGRLLICGNGGSAADAQHFAAEFVNRFLIERPPLPALALTTDSSILTSIGNDYTFNEIFVKQVKALGKPGDVLWAMSTSGNSPNVIAALAAARTMGIKTIAMTGAGGGEAKNHADLLIAVPTGMTPRIQELHAILGHLICELVDYILFQRPGEAREHD